MIIAMAMTILILGLVVPFFVSNARVMSSQSRRMDALQNARFATSSIDRDLRVAGSGVVSSQPLIVQADSMAVTFNVDLVSRSQSDAGAVYYDPDADAGGVSVMLPSGSIVLPRSSRSYPDTTYKQNGGAPSTAETISFWVAPDTAPDGGGLNALYRRVNNLPATVVARGLMNSAASPVFRYYKADTIGRLVEIPKSLLPIFHTAKIHGSPADSQYSALTDSIRLVRLSFSAKSVDREGKTTIKTVETGVRIMNAGLLHHSTCGEPPIFSSAVDPSVDNTDPPAKVNLSWSRSSDEVSGEKDIERYAVFRRRAATLEFGEPIASVPAGNASYIFTDTDVASGDQWVYGIAAEDCSGQLSSIRSTATVVIP
jgi:hypothetical protein